MRTWKEIGQFVVIAMVLAIGAGLFLYAQSDQTASLGRSNRFAGKFNQTIFGSEDGYHVGSNSTTADFAGKVTLSSGSATVTFVQPFTVAPVCVATDQTANASVKAAPAAASVVFTGTGSDVISYVCIGQPQ